MVVIAFPEPVYLLGIVGHVIVCFIKLAVDGRIKVLKVELFHIRGILFLDQPDKDIDFFIGELDCALSVDGYFA